MTEDFFCGIAGFILGVVLTLVFCAKAWDEAKVAHHRSAYDEYGQLACEICKALAEKGVSK